MQTTDSYPNDIPESHAPLWARAFDNLARMRRQFIDGLAFANATRQQQGRFALWLDEMERFVRILIIALALTYIVPRECLYAQSEPAPNGKAAPDHRNGQEKPAVKNFIIMSVTSEEEKLALAFLVEIGECEPLLPRACPARPRQAPPQTEMTKLFARFDAMAHAMNNAGDLAMRLAIRFARDVENTRRTVRDWMRSRREAEPVLLPNLLRMAAALLPPEAASFVRRNPVAMARYG